MALIRPVHCLLPLLLPVPLLAQDAKLRAALVDKDPRRRARAVRHLVDLKLEAKDALPLLFGCLGDTNQTVLRIAMDGIVGYRGEAVPALLELLGRRDSAARWPALTVVGRLGKKARAAVPLLARMLAEVEAERKRPEPEDQSPLSLRKRRRELRSRHWRVLRALGALGPEAAPVLFPYLGHEIELLRNEAAGALARVSPDTGELLRLGRSERDELRVAVLDVFRLLSGDLGQAAPHLVAALDDRSPAARAMAIGILERRRGGRAAVSLLRRRMRRTEGGRRSATMLLLAAIDRRPISLPVFEDAMRSEDGAVRALAARLLRKLPEASVAALDTLARGIGDPDSRVRIECLRVLEALGPRAGKLAGRLPVFLKDEHATPRGQVILIAGKLGKSGLPLLEQAMQHESYVLRRHAVEALPKLGREALPAIPRLLEMIERDVPSVRAAAIRTLGKLPVASGGPWAQQHLEGVLRAFAPEHRAYRSHGIRALKDLGPHAKPGLKHLMAQIRRAPGQALTQTAIQALGAIGPDAAEAVPLLVELLDGDAKLCRPSLEALARIARNVEPGVAGRILPKLRALLGAELPVARSAAFALGALGEPALPELRALLAKRDPHRRLHVHVLRGLAGSRPGLVMALAKDENSNTAWAALEALGHAQSELDAVLATLLRALRERLGSLGLPALGAIAALGPRAEAAIPELMKTLAGESRELSLRATEALGSIGAAALPSLLPLLEHEDPGMAMHAMTALAQIGPAAADAVPGIVALANSTTRSDVQQLAVTTLPALGRRGKLAVGRLDVPARFLTQVFAALLGSKDTLVRHRSLMALARRPAPARHFRPHVVALTRDPDPRIRRNAVHCLGLLPPRRESLEALLAACYDHDPRVRQQAVRSLGRSGSRSLMGELREALLDRNEKVRREAEKAIARLEAGSSPGQR